MQGNSHLVISITADWLIKFANEVVAREIISRNRALICIYGIYPITSETMVLFVSYLNKRTKESELIISHSAPFL